MRKMVLSEYRTELMGISAIGVLIVHSGEVISMSSAAGKILGHGGIGVYIFMLLSALGLCSSMTAAPAIRAFYKKRFVRIAIPFVLFSLPWYVVKDIILTPNIMYFIGDMTTVSFWTRHTGAWFVAALIPIYLIFPFYFKWLKRGQYGMKTALVILTDIIIQQILFMTCPDIMDEFSQVFQSIWVFCLGCYWSESFINTNKEPLWTAFPFIPLYIISRLGNVNDVTVIGSVLYAYKGVLFCVLFICLIKAVKQNLKDCILFRIFRWMGRHSLESYLTNDYLICAFSALHAAAVIQNQYIRYFIILAAGLCLSAVGAIMEKHMKLRLQQKI